MTTIAFTPSADAPFVFQATLDGDPYSCVVIWNVAAQRYYITILDSSNNTTVCRALVGSEAGNPINLVYSYFTVSTLVFYAVTETFEILP